ncbi:hypothetical protein [Afipia clevelandensis]|uniref:Uncharacterized protein n=1 Tax=Afipia clevelandensis ATCC 49720 TaxID=883079 RepID=K8P9N8_9BRAD|nr:hypothetical protein [Afipia clevelandensis]EKS35098.1 hypothetical protein HMPREF9696_02370 [Afipia clevelandensis ATCC 49720]
MRGGLVIVAAALLFSGQAHAQGRARPDTSGPAEAKGEDPQKRMAREEAAARAAMKNIPDSKEKYDPWKIGK